ncbi:MAG TPA: MFS transporter, partial [Hymenobacter sp.]
MQTVPAHTEQPLQAESTSHPKGLYLLFATEMWERFSYYGMRAVLVLFLTKAMMMDKAFASKFYGGYTSLIYLTPLIGGFIADRYWGNRRSILTGGVLMALGQFTLFFAASNYGPAETHSLSHQLLYLGLGFMILGNGFFKPNISSMVGSLYSATDKR